MVTINIKGPIISNGEKWIYNWFEEDSTCPNDVINVLPVDGAEVTVIINSMGGYVDAGDEIYTALRSYPGRVTVDIVNAGSAASLIAMAGDNIRITPVGKIMIHNVACVIGGDYRVMDKTSEILKKFNQSICKSYELKTGLAQEELLKLMDAETWLTAEEAKEKGFVDEIMFQDQGEIKLVASNAKMLSETIVSKMQNLKNSGKLDEPKYLENPTMNNQLLNEMIDQAVEKALSKEKQIVQQEKEPENSISRFLF